MNEKKGQMEISFSTIFSVILIAVIIVVAFYVIRYFIELGNCGKIGMFYENLQDRVDDAFNREETSTSFKIQLPSGITYACIADMEKGLTSDIAIEKGIFNEIKRTRIPGANIFLYPREKSCDMQAREIKHIDLQGITEQRNPYCFKNGADIKILKSYSDRLVFLQ